jgi:hypothetical protein
MLLYPANPPDLALRDFYFFGSLKEKLQEIVLRNRENLISEIRRFFDEIDKETLIAVSVSEAESLCRVIQHKGEYFHKSANDIQISCELNEQWAPTN